ncbi:MAG: YqiA/YcfP family alpha/beta fold hydrolase [Candidatus Aenigmatarchaeota archaeon]
MKEEKVEFENQGEKIIGFLTSPNLKTNSLILLVHGFTGNMNGPADLYKRLAYKLTENGFAVYRFNFRFTSDSFEDYHKMTISGEVNDLKFLINEFSKKYDKIGVVGESLGGAISILGYSSKVKCMVLFYPAIFFKENIANRWSSDEQIKEMNEKGILPWVRSSGQKLYVGKKFIEEINRIEILPEIQKIKCPILFIHGNVDTTVNFSESERAFKIANEPKRIEIIDGAHHGFKDRDYQPSEELQDKAINLTLYWFNKWLK